MQNSNYIQDPMAQVYKQVYSQPVVNPVVTEPIHQPNQQQLTPEQLDYIRNGNFSITVAHPQPIPTSQNDASPQGWGLYAFSLLGIIVWIFIVGLIENNRIYTFKEILEGLKRLVIFIVCIVVIGTVFSFIMKIYDYYHPNPTIEDICREEYTNPRNINECVRMKKGEIMSAYYQEQKRERIYNLKLTWFEAEKECKKYYGTDKLQNDDFYICQINYLMDKHPDDFQKTMAGCKYVQRYQYVECVENELGIRGKEYEY